ncbi:MAG TPA: RES domain-containing protein [Vicinamibacterales bacterium]|nr:RES domain-containing protein [Vicinamibacterales bacterium]
MRVWRLTTAAHAALDGEGARRYGSRWMPRGYAIVYASATLSLAALERLVHTDTDLVPSDLVAIAIDIRSGLSIDSIELSELPGDWRAYPPPESLAALGERWIRGGNTAVLSVPSAVIPAERNFLLNPAHADFRRCSHGPPEPFTFDPRLR